MDADRKKLGILQLLGALVLLSAASYFLVFAPKLKEVGGLAEAVERKESEMGTALRMWGAVARSSGEETRRWEAQAQAWREKVPESPETDRLMEEIGRRAVRHNLTGVRLTVPAENMPERSATVEGPGASGAAQGQEKSRAFAETRLQLSFFSTYRDMAEFVDGIPRMKRLLSLRSVTVREKDSEMETTLELTAFHRKPK